MTEYEIKDGVGIIPEGTEKVYVDADCCEAIKEVVIPSSVTEISNEAFRNCYHLEKVVIPNSVKKIGKEAFYECRELKELFIPDSVKEIGMETFYNCKKLEKVEKYSIEYSCRKIW